MTQRGMDFVRGQLRDGRPRVRRERASLWVSVLSSDLKAKTQRLSQVVADYRDALELRTGIEADQSDLPHVDAEDRRKAFWNRAGGFAVLVIETILAVGLSIWSLTLWPILSGIVGAVVAIAWTLGSLGVHYGRGDAGRPEASLQAARRGAGVSFYVGLVGFVPLLLARTVPEAALLTGIATAVISLGFSSLAAYLFLLAFLIAWAEPYAKEYATLQAEIALTQQLVEEAGEIASGRFPLRRNDHPDSGSGVRA
jgi:hypothetical protein